MKTILRIFAMVLLTYVLLSMTACESKKEDNSATEVIADAEERIDRERKELAADLRELQRSIDRKVETVEKKLEKTEGDAREKLQEANQKLLHERKEVSEAIDKIENATEET